MNEGIISLRKGGVISLRKNETGLKNIIVGLGWDVKNTTTGFDYDLDVSCFMLDNSGKIPNDGFFVFYNNKVSIDGSVKHSGDDRTGGNSETGDDEQVKVDLSSIDHKIEKIVFLVTIHDAVSRKQSFGQVLNSYVRVVDAIDNREVARLDLTEEHSTDISVVACELEKVNDEWRFNAVGQGYHYDLMNFVNKYYQGGCQY